MKSIFFVFSMLFCALLAHSQEVIPVIKKPSSRDRSIPTDTTTKKKDDGKNLGFEHRDDAKDAVTVTYRFLDSTNRYNLDSSINDFDNYFTVPSHYQTLGNNGLAAYAYIFRPFDKIGWDAGFHAFDVYRFTLDNTKIYKTNRPFTNMGYELGSGKEQVIQAMHVQNPKPNISFGLDYRVITSPGFFTTQNASHNNVRLFGNYEGRRKRYRGTVVLLNNKIRASENGGIENINDINDPNKTDRFIINVNLGNAAPFAPNPFITSIYTGNDYRDFNFLLKQSYDLGIRDSVEINDSTTEYLFYSKLRLQHTISYQNFNYAFKDVGADSVIYQRWYDSTLNKLLDTFSINQKWSVITNDFSLFQFPDIKNSAQFFSAGASLENINGTLGVAKKQFYNVMVHAEYRNKTRNKKWDILASGKFYATGLNAGDYNASAYLSRYLNKKLGQVSLFFKNSNRSPSFIYDDRSNFNFGNTNNYKKENITSLGASALNPFVNLHFANYLLTNYHYFTNYYKTDQYNKPINIIQVQADKKIKLTKRINWYAEAALQQTDAASPIKLPLFYSRNRIAFEGIFYKNLNVSSGLEIRYASPFKADNYSPVMGQFFPQDTITISNRPDVSAFLHFRIKGFTGYLRAENLNTVSFKNGFGFTHNNFAAPTYPTPGLIIRFGIRWWFIN